MKKGFILAYRSMQDHWTYENAEHFKAWMTILMEVNHSEKITKRMYSGILIECGQGQSTNSLDTWASKLGRGWDKSKVRRFFKLLENDNMIKTESVKKTTRLTVCNYSPYQHKRHEVDTRSTRGRHEVDTQSTPNNNVNNLNNVTMKQCNNENKLVKVKRVPTQQASQLAELLLISIRQTSPNQSDKSLETWAADIDKMLRIDKADFETVERVIRYLPFDDFWNTNILSGGKLRKQFDKLLANMSKAKNGKKPEILSEAGSCWVSLYHDLKQEGKLQ